MDCDKTYAWRDTQSELSPDAEFPGCLRLRFKNIETSSIDTKVSLYDSAAINLNIAIWMFRLFESYGIRTHFVSKISDREIRVRLTEPLPFRVMSINPTGEPSPEKNRYTAIVPHIQFLFAKDTQRETVVSKDTQRETVVSAEFLLASGYIQKHELRSLTKSLVKMNRELTAVFDEIGLELRTLRARFGRDQRGLVLASEVIPTHLDLWLPRLGRPFDCENICHEKSTRGRDIYGDLLERLSYYSCCYPHKKWWQKAFRQVRDLPECISGFFSKQSGLQ